jgi:hypothetical protein
MPPDFCVKIYIDGTQRQIGSGVVIHQDWVLTAGHLTTSVHRGEEPLVVAGAQQAVGIINDNRTLSPVGGLGPDLALFKLKTPIHVSQVRWADAAAFGSACGGTLVGFGSQTGHDERSCHFDLTRCMPAGVAAGRYAYDPDINFVAVQAPGFEYHPGDSGGAMLIASGGNQLALAGIFSGGASAFLGPGGPAPFAHRRFALLWRASQWLFRLSFPWTKGMFTRTDRHKDWAQRVTGETFP